MPEETHRAGEVVWVAEPARESERMLKTRWRERFRSGLGLIEAYRVCVRYEHAPERSDFNFVKAGGEEFAELFDPTQSWDTIWLPRVPYQRIVTVPIPFYRRVSTGNA